MDRLQLTRTARGVASVLFVIGAIFALAVSLPAQRIRVDGASSFANLSATGTITTANLSVLPNTGFIGWDSSTTVRASANGTFKIRDSSESTNTGILDVSGFNRNGRVLISQTAPTIASGFGTTNIGGIGTTGTIGIAIITGNNGTDTGGVLTMPAATTGWLCSVNDRSEAAANTTTNAVQTGYSTTSVTIQNQTKSTGAAAAFGVNDEIILLCVGY